MRIQVAALYLISAVFTASTAPITDLIQDKPDRLYIISDNLTKDTYTRNRTIDNSGGTVEEQIWHHDDYQWQLNIGGNGTEQDVQQSDDWDSDGWLWGATNHTSAVMWWETNGSGTEINTANDGLTASFPIGLPLLVSEHCLVNDPQSPPSIVWDLGDGFLATNQVYEEYFRYSQTHWGLQTGGRPGRSSLFQLSATAARILDKRAERPFDGASSQAIPPQNITLMGHALYPDTNLWMVLPDGTNLDATPFVAGVDFYRMDPSRQKYVPSLTINEQSLDYGAPEFCAGQHLDLQLVFDPPPGVVSQVSVWNLPGPPVNDDWQAGTNGSVNYWFNSGLLSNLTTSCWYPSGGARTASVTSSLQFPNGQSCSLTVQGSFSIAKPSLIDFDSCPSFIGFGWSSPILQANMRWGVAVQSAYDGNVGVTQLINGTNLCCNTGGQFQLDGAQEIYNVSPTNLLGQAYSATNSSTHTVAFVYSRKATANPGVDLSASFRDYLRFRPSGNASIWVTLGTNSWSMDGSASLSNGLTRSNLPPAGALIQTDEFPSWTDHL